MTIRSVRRAGIPARVCLAVAVLALFVSGLRSNREADAPRFRTCSFPPLLVAAAAPALLLCGYDLAAEICVSEYERSLDRDPATGIMRGAEPYVSGRGGSEGAALLVHGFLGAGSNFNRLPERLAGMGWEVHVMLLPGHGTTPRDLEKVTPDDMVRAVRDEVLELRRKHERILLVGHSMGGALCTIAAADAEVSGLVLCAPFFEVTRKRWYLLRPERWAGLFGHVARWVYKGEVFVMVNRREAKEHILSYRWAPMKGIATLFEVGRRASSPDVLRRITCPVLLIHSRGDDASSWKAAERAFGMMKSPRKRTVLLEDSNHHLFWDYDRERVMEEIELFAASLVDE